MKVLQVFMVGPVTIVTGWGWTNPFEMAENKWITGVKQKLGVTTPFITIVGGPPSLFEWNWIIAIIFAENVSL